MADYDFAFGLVSKNGSREYGGNRWTPSRISTGRYQIKFDRKFGNRPAITVTAEQSVGGAIIANVLGENARNRREFVTVETRLENGQVIDSAFHFIGISEED